MGHAHASAHGDAGHHARDAPAALPVHVVTVTDTRTAAEDRSGALARELLEGAGFTVSGPTLVKDEVEQIRAAVLEALAAGARAVVLNGGTGVAPRDVTPEALAPLLEKPLPGFGEAFRACSFREIGTAAWLSRAAAGTRGRSLLVALPGSTAAVRLGLEQVLLPQLRHVLGLLAG